MQKLADRPVRLERVPKAVPFVQGIPVAPALLGPFDGALRFKVGEDLLDGTVGDSHSAGDVEKPDIGVLGQAQ